MATHPDNTGNTGNTSNNYTTTDFLPSEKIYGSGTSTDSDTSSTGNSASNSANVVSTPSNISTVKHEWPNNSKTKFVAHNILAKKRKRKSEKQAHIVKYQNTDIEKSAYFLSKKSSKYVMPGFGTVSSTGTTSNTPMYKYANRILNRAITGGLVGGGAGAILSAMDPNRPEDETRTQRALRILRNAVLAGAGGAAIYPLTGHLLDNIRTQVNNAPDGPDEASTGNTTDTSTDTSTPRVPPGYVAPDVDPDTAQQQLSESQEFRNRRMQLAQRLIDQNNVSHVGELGNLPGIESLMEAATLEPEEFVNRFGRGRDLSNRTVSSTALAYSRIMEDALGIPNNLNSYDKATYAREVLDPNDALAYIGALQIEDAIHRGMPNPRLVSINSDNSRGTRVANWGKNMLRTVAPSWTEYLDNVGRSSAGAAGALGYNDMQDAAIRNMRNTAFQRAVDNARLGHDNRSNYDWWNATKGGTKALAGYAQYLPPFTVPTLALDVANSALEGAMNYTGTNAIDAQSPYVRNYQGNNMYRDLVRTNANLAPASYKGRSTGYARGNPNIRVGITHTPTLPGDIRTAYNR